MQSMSTYLVVTQVGVSGYNIRLKVDIRVTDASFPAVKPTNGVNLLDTDMAIK
jgi:hypothetical protein